MNLNKNTQFIGKSPLISVFHLFRGGTRFLGTVAKEMSGNQKQFLPSPLSPTFISPLRKTLL